MLALSGASLLLLVSLRWQGDWWVGWVLFFANSAAALMCHVINHNASHVPLFEQDGHNRVAFAWLSWLLGIPAAPIAASHIHNHHVHNNDEHDWMRSSVLGDSQGLWRLAKYVLHVFSLPPLKERAGHQHIPSALYARIIPETTIVALALLVALWWAPAATLWFYVLARLCAMSVLFLINLVQHDGLEAESGVNRCRNFTGKLINSVLFHNGFHSAHHLRPGLHWSELPHFHQEKVEPGLKPELSCASLSGFIVARYLVPSPWRERVWS